MESDKFPTIRFELDEAVRQGAVADSMDVILRGQFLIHGVTKEVELPATLVFLGDGVRVRSTIPLNLKDYKIGGLSKIPRRPQDVGEDRGACGCDVWVPVGR